MFFLAPSDAFDGDWNQFRGPNGQGVLQGEIRLPDRLDDSNLAWKIPCPAGHSSPVVLGDRVILSGFEGKTLYVDCYQLTDGRMQWRKELPVKQLEKFHPQHGPASSTPVCDGKHIVATFGSFGIIALDLDGHELWRHEYEPSPNMFGTASSPILHDSKLISFYANEKISLLQCLETSSGKVLWERKREGPASSWSTPTLFQTRKGPIVLFYEPYQLRACSIDGHDLWSVPGLADEPITIPQILGDLVITTSYNLRTNQEALGLPTFQTLLQECDKNGDQLIDLEESKANKSILSRPDADGQGDHPLRMFFKLLDEDKGGSISETEWPRIHRWMDPWNHANGFVAIRLDAQGESPQMAWQFDRGVPECPTPLLIGSRLIAVRNGGTVTCVNGHTGELLQQERLAGGGPYYASPVAGDHKIYFASARGDVTIANLQDDKLTVLSKNPIGETIQSTPALCSAGLLLRTDSFLRLYRSPRTP